MARPRKPIDEKLLVELAKIHCTYDEMAAVLKISSSTLERRYSALIKEGLAQGKTSLKRHMWIQAQKGNVTMLIWLSKNLLGMSDKVEEKLDASSTTTVIYKLQWADEGSSPPTALPDAGTKTDLQ